ncbi:restriction endonuclease [Acidovorax sp. BoFeN1]|uniref:restriction endonuclease n=1 Tax=Acidovorax sp. BoFeN1 TaxID=1231053 RepID=UPI000E095D92|nr:restriction endonuclease [Acidovorax sp. BoFeN1]RDD93229.1 restriction endonuclease [Acidovorax sp. BoFeN1]
MSEFVELPNTWAFAPLSSIADVNPRSFCPLPSAVSQPVHFVPMSAVTEEFGGIDISARRPLGDVQKGYTSFLTNDVLLAKITPCMENGKLALVPPLQDHLAFGSTEFHVLRAKDQVQPSWLAYFLSQSAFRRLARQNMTGSAGQLRVATTWLSDALIPVAPATEQTRIVAKLEELLSDLDAGVAELKAAQKKLAQYRQSLLKAAVEGALTAAWRTQHQPTETGAQLLQRILQERRARWEARQLAKFAEQGKTPPKDWQKKYPEPVQPDTSGLPELPQEWVWASVEQIASDERYSLAIGPFGSNLKVPDYRNSGVPLVFVRNIRSGNYGGAYTKYVTSEKAEELSAHSIAAGDVLITKMGEPPGDADVYPSDQPPAIITADCIKVRCWAGLLRPDFLKTVINSYIGQRQIEPMTQGVAQKKVSLGRFTSLAVPIPSLHEQDLLMKMVSAADGDAVAQEAAIAFSLQQSTAQRQNILRAAFSGQLVPQDPHDEPASVLLERIRAERAAQGAVKKPRGRKAKEAA